MTAILNEIRRLDALLSRGELSRAEYAARRENLLQSVEDAEPVFDNGPTPRHRRVPSRSRPAGTNALGLSIAICFGVMAISTGLTLILLPDLNLALTLGVTVLAALSVALLRDLDG